MSVTISPTKGSDAAPVEARGGFGGRSFGSLRGGRLQKFLEQARCYAALPRHAHRPDFRIASVTARKYREHYVWITDGEQRIGLVNKAFGEIELFRFFPPADGVRVEYKMPEIYTWVTLRGARISIVPQGGSGLKGEMTYPQSGGETLRISYAEDMKGKMRLRHEFALRFDPVLGYVLDCDYDLAMAKPRRFEYANILAGGLADSRDDLKRFQKCIWARRDGKICYMYQNPLSLMQWFGPAWKDMPPGGFVGWVAEQDMNPFLEIASSTPSTFETCIEWYDQHVIAKPPTRKSADGFYHITAAYRLLSLPLPVAKELEDAARTMLPVDSPLCKQRMGFRQGMVNDFETPVPAGALYNGCLWEECARLDRKIGHSGTHSLRLQGRVTARPILGGVPLMVDKGKRYRFAAWVRTRGATGKGVSIHVNEVIWSWDDVHASHGSKSLKGDNEWTRLEVEFEPKTWNPIAVPCLVVDGEGMAWFDDVELVEAPE